MTRLAEATAIAWVDRLVIELIRQARPICGGWPGTMSEARALVATQLSSEERTSLGENISSETLARWVYKLARQAWLAKASTTPEI